MDKKQTSTEYALDQKWQSLQASILAAEVLIAEETASLGDPEKSPRLRAAQKNLADAKNLLGEVAAGVPAMQRLARLASFPEHNHNPIIEISLTGNIEYINPAAHNLFPDLQEKGSLHPYLTGWQELVEQVRREPALPLDREVQLEDRYYQQSIICIEEHHCLRIYGRDVTAHKMAEQAVQESEQRFRTLIDEAPVAIALSRESKFLYVNPAYLEMHGVESLAELIDQPIYERVAPESLDDSRERADRRAQGLPVEKRYEYTALRKDGSLVPVIAAVTSVTLADGPATVGFFQDISERKKAELSLQQSQALLNAIITTTPDLIFLKDRDCRMLLANPAFIAAVGKPAEQIIGKTDAEFYDDPAIGRAFNENDRRVMESGQMELIEEYQSLPAIQRVYLSTKSPYRDDQGNIIGVICVAHDITRRKQIEKEREDLFAQVQLERDRLQTLLESLNDEVWFCDQHGKILLANQAAVHNIGYNSLEELNTTISALANDLEVYNPDGTPRSPDEVALARTFKEGAPVFGEDIIRNRRTGELKYREYNTALIRSAAGQLLGAVAVVRDISQRKQAELALQQSQALLNAIMTGTPDPVFLKDHECRMLLANSATLAVLGKPAEQVIGKTDAEFYDDPAVGLAIMENDRRVMESGQTEVVEEQVYTPTSERVFLSTKTPYRDACGNIIGVIGVAHDITERKKQEVELKQLSRTLRAISNSNQALMHTESEKQFMDQVCDIIVKDCGYKMVWIGFAEQDQAKSVRPVASAGFDQSYLDTLNITWADTERGRGPTGTAIRTGQPSLCRNMRTDPKFKPWYSEAIKRGYASSLVLPLLSGGQAFGALTIYSEMPDPFSEDEIKLLTELTFDLAYGITSLRLRTANLIAQEALRASEERYRSLFTSMTEGFALREIIYDENGQPCDYRFLDVNPAFERLTGLKAENVIGKSHHQVLPDDDNNLIRIYGEVALTGQPVHFENYSPTVKQYYELYAFRPAPHQCAILFLNITERKQIEEALRASEERYRSLFAGMTEGFALHEIICDENGQPCDYRFLEINPAFERLTGLKQQDVIGKLHNQLLPDDDPNWVKIYGKVALSGDPVHFENYSPALKAHYEVFAYCPAPHQFAVLFMNITDRKQAEEKIRQSERLYRAIGETLDYGVWVCAPDGRNVYASESFLKLVGMTQQQCSDFGWGDVLHPDDAERTMAAWKECVRTGGTWDIEHRYRGVDGQWHPILARGVPIRDEQGQITSWAGINLDISKQKQAEQALQEAHDKLEQRVQERTEELQSINEELNTEVEEHKLAEETIFRNAARSENLAEISRRLAAAGLGLQKVFDILSQSIAELIGDTCIVRLLSEDRLELDLASVYHSDSAKREHLSTILRDLPIKSGEGISGKVIRSGCSFLLPTTAPHQLTGLIEPQEQPVVDELQIYSLMCVPLRQEENIIGTIAAIGGLERAPYTQEDLSFLEDVANRAGLSIAKARLYRELECALEREQNTRAQLIQSEKYAALARMVASVAHEINNPVQTIKNCMYLLSTSIDRNSQGYEILDMAASEANRIGNLVSRLRDLYRPSRESTRKTVSMLDVLNNVNALLEPHLVQNKVKMEIETCTDRYCVNANADQIKQVFLNISLNAIDAMEPAGGSLSVKVSCPSDSQVCISFKDTGKGMSVEEMQHIFEPLYTTKEKGTGLGLAISYEIISNHNGHITTESQPGQGTTFSVWLPIVNTDLAGG